MAAFPESRIEELRSEKALLLKAERDIEEGWKRLRNQQELFLELQAAGHDTRQAERLICSCRARWSNGSVTGP